MSSDEISAYDRLVWPEQEIGHLLATGQRKREFRAYFLATLVYRMVSASWVVWDMSFQIRQGPIASRLLRPVHPLIQFAAQQSAAIPLRIALAAPIAAAAVAWVGRDAITDDPVDLFALPLLLAGAWAITFVWNGPASITPPRSSMWSARSATASSTRATATSGTRT